MNTNETKHAAWWEALVALDVMAGGTLALVAGWAWLVCEVNGGGACGCLLWLLPAGGLLAAAGAMLADGTPTAVRGALGCKFAAAALLAVTAATHFSETGTIGWPGLGVALVLLDVALTARDR